MNDTESLFSVRFNRPVRVTVHARQRMRERDISADLLLDLIETGALRHKDERHAWLFKHYAERDDNLLCAAVVADAALIVKTVMHHFRPED